MKHRRDSVEHKAVKHHLDALHMEEFLGSGMTIGFPQIAGGCLCGCVQPFFEELISGSRHASHLESEQPAKYD